MNGSFLTFTLAVLMLALAFWTHQPVNAAVSLVEEGTTEEEARMLLEAEDEFDDDDEDDDSDDGSDNGNEDDDDYDVDQLLLEEEAKVDEEDVEIEPGDTEQLRKKKNKGPKKPNLVVIMTDDYGWANIGYHRTEDSKPEEIRTPNLDKLANSGVKLERFYSFHMCSPSRCAFQTGRYSMHVNQINAAPESVNPDDKVSGYAGIPLAMSTIADKLKSLGYWTAAVGKWDVGMATPQHTPQKRGYTRSLIYYNHAIDYFTCGVPITAIGEINVCLNRFTDLWFNGRPGKKMCRDYVEKIFADYAIVQIKQAKKHKKPLFLFYSSHLVHSPLQVPNKVLKKFKFIDNIQRRRYAAMTNYLDTTVGRLVNNLKRQKMYSNTLIIFFSDNGGSIYNLGAANNYPLRAGKYADFEGGVRVNAFASGGLIPVPRRNTVSEELIHIADVYATFIRLGAFGPNGEVDPVELQALLADPKALAAGLPQPDGVDTIWGAITGNPDEPKRSEIWLSPNALLIGEYKIVTGVQPQDMWQGPFYPNNSGPIPNINDPAYETDCGPRGCLFNVFSDPTEHQDLASSETSRINAMLQRLAELNQTIFDVDRGTAQVQACVVAKQKYGGYYGPFVFLP